MEKEEKKVQSANFDTPDAKRLLRGTPNTLREQFLEADWLDEWGELGSCVRETPVGFVNIYFLCYMNSVLQCLIYTPPLALRCKELQRIYEENDKDRESERNLSNLEITVASTIIDCFNPLLMDVVFPGRLMQEMQNVIGDFNISTMQDPSEFLLLLVDKCHNLMSSVFSGGYSKHVFCFLCCYNAVISEKNSLLNVGNIQYSETLEEALRSGYFNTETQQRCSACKHETSISTTFFANPPKVLVLQLMRYDYGEGVGSHKIMKHVIFEEELYVTEFLDPLKQEDWAGNVKYKLYGVIAHLGATLNSGHIVAYVKHPNGEWFACNDTRVCRIDFEYVQTEEAYLLFYLLDTNIDRKKSQTKDESNSENIRERTAQMRRRIRQVIKRSNRRKRQPGMLYRRALRRRKAALRRILQKKSKRGCSKATRLRKSKIITAFALGRHRHQRLAFLNRRKRRSDVKN